MGTKDEKQDEEELRIVTDDPSALEDEETTPSPAPQEKAEKRLGASEDDDDDDDDEDSADQRRDRSKGDRKSRSQRRREGRERAEREINFLMARNEQLERQISQIVARQNSSDMSNLDTRIAQVKAAINRAGEVIEAGVTEKDGAAVREATEIRDQLRDSLRQLEETKKTRSTDAESGEEAPQLPKRALQKAQAWAKANRWFDFNRGDFDSRIAGAIDDSLVAEGYDPASDEYWDELNSRIAKQLPHRASGGKKNGRDSSLDDDENDEEEEQETQSKSKNKRQPGGPRFRVGGRERPLKPNEVYLSRERVEALKEAGVWEDPVLRQKYLKRYQKYDEEHGVNTR